MSRLLLDTREMADVVGIAPGTLRRWAKERRVPVLKINARTWKFDPEKVKKALNSFEQKAVA